MTRSGRTPDQWRLGLSPEPWPTTGPPYTKFVDVFKRTEQRRSQRTHFLYQARSYAFCTSAHLACTPRSQVQTPPPLQSGRSKPRRWHQFIQLALIVSPYPVKRALLRAAGLKRVKWLPGQPFKLLDPGWTQMAQIAQAPTSRSQGLKRTQTTNESKMRTCRWGG